METALQSDSAKERGRAALSLGRGGDPSVIPSLLPLLEDSSSRVRERSHQALIQLTGRDHQYDPDAAPEERQESLAQWNAWWKRLQNRSPREWWHDAIRTGTPKERARAVHRLADSDARESVPWIVEALRDPSGGVRESAYYALQELLGQDFAFDPDAPARERERSIQNVLRRWSRQQ
jgi:HEAT repeat protein